MSGPARPTPRLVVGLFTLLAIAGLLGLVGIADALRQDHPAAGPLTPEVEGGPDTLREEVVCEVTEGREGEDREQVTGPALPLAITSNELYDCPQTWDGRRVSYTGEVVGATLSRGATVWVQLNDDAYADAAAPLPTHRDFRGGNAGVGVLISAEDARRIQSIGGFGRHGDLMEIVGTFARVDAETGEVAVIRAEQARVLRVGEEIEIPDAPARPMAAIAAAVFAVGASLLERRSRGRR